MEKYSKAFEEVEVLMNEILEQLNIELDETNLYPTDDIFRIIIKAMDVENIKTLSYVFNYCEISEVEKYMTPVVNTFMWWWADCFEYGSFSIPELIAGKEKELIFLSMSEEGSKKKVKRI
ncbi:hypothetical protein NUF46_003284 [Yersinia enterocolitica]|nr:hypothetical protein [Yersinia enterocolitica]